MDKYTDLIFKVEIGLILVIFGVIMWIWFYNRKRYNMLKHQIPATVVKNYLDSIIQNSTSLKSSLFRGGGLDVDPSSIPSVMPLQELAGGTNVGMDAGAGSADEAALKAQIAALQAQLAEKQNVVTDLEAQNAALEGTVKQKQERIEELEKLLAEAQAKAAEGGGGGGADPAALEALENEKAALQEELKQYDVLSEDIANLKRYKQENEQLKKALEEAGGAAPAAAAAAAPAVAEAVAEPEPAPAPEPVAAAEPEPVAEPEPTPEPVAAAEEVPEAPGAEADEKSPEDLLSEFEKMLG